MIGTTIRMRLERKHSEQAHDAEKVDGRISCTELVVILPPLRPDYVWNISSLSRKVVPWLRFHTVELRLGRPSKEAAKFDRVADAAVTVEKVRRPLAVFRLYNRSARHRRGVCGISAKAPTFRDNEEMFLSLSRGDDENGHHFLS